MSTPESALTEHPRAATAPTPTTERSIAPDLARGAMLLLIAIANAPWYLWASDDSDPSPLDRVVQTLALIAVDGRTYPMFAFLFGYGIWQLYSRQIAAGVSRREARRLLRRRHWWMLAFGFVHAALLWMGDIVGAYGLAGLLLVWIFLDRRDRTLKAWAVVLTCVLALAGVAAALIGPLVPLGSEMDSDLGGLPSPMAESNYLLSIALRLSVWSLLTPVQGLIGLVVPVAILLAILAARHRVLEDPLAHLPLLRRTALIGIGVGWGVGIVIALQSAGVLGIPAVFDLAVGVVQFLSGLFCGVGYVALFGLISARLERRGITGRVAGALQAVGKRSLTFYLAQSVIFAPVMSAWGFGLGAQLSQWSIALWAVGTWLVTVALAVVLERKGQRGPAEWLLRRLAYPARPLRPRLAP